MDVRDAVRAYWILSEQKDIAGEVYNIGGDTIMRTGVVLEMMKSMAKCPIQHEVDPSLFRPSDVTLQIPDTAKFRNLTGWKPEIPIEQTFKDLLNYYRERVT
jgi:GDPmannose 4,6-dehydratase/GDP-4-dehydro-6-deoxy-D-mannose reductase